MNIYETVMQLCAERKIDKTALEQACGFSQNSINKWKKSIPSIKNVSKVADFFDVSVDYLIGRKKNQVTTTNATELSVYSKEEAIITPHIISYVDILGTKEMMKINQDLFSKILNQAYDCYKDLVKKFNPMIKIKMCCFSDNVVFAVEYNKKTAHHDAYLLSQFTAMYQLDLLADRHITARGGICIGDLYINDTFAIGNGLVEAYLMEESNPYPRILLSPEITEILDTQNMYATSPNLVKYDFDNKPYLDFFAVAGNDDWKIINDVINQRVEENYSTREVLKKYIWLKNYAGNFKNKTNKSFVEIYAEVFDCQLQNTHYTDKIAENYKELWKERYFYDTARLYSGVKLEYRSVIFGCVVGALQALKVNTKQILGY